MNRQRCRTGTGRWLARSGIVGHNEAAFRVDRGLNLEIPGPGHIRRGNLGVLLEISPKVVFGTSVRTRIVRILEGAAVLDLP